MSMSKHIQEHAQLGIEKNIRTRLITNILAPLTGADDHLTPAYISGANATLPDTTSVQLIANTANHVDCPIVSSAKANQFAIRFEAKNISLTDDLQISLKDNFGLAVATINFDLTDAWQTFGFVLDGSASIAATIEAFRIAGVVGVTTGDYQIRHRQVEIVTGNLNQAPSRYIEKFVSKQLNGSFNEDDATGTGTIIANGDSNTTNSGWVWGNGAWIITGGNAESQTLGQSWHSKQDSIGGRFYEFTWKVDTAALLALTLAGEPGFPAGVGAHSEKFMSTGVYELFTATNNNNCVIDYMYCVECNPETNIDGQGYDKPANNNYIVNNILYSG